MSETKVKTKVDLLITNAAEVITCTGEGMSGIGVVKNGWVAVKDGKIAGVGTEVDIKEKFEAASSDVINAERKVIAPGFIDSHTHLVFYGTRVEEYAAKVAGYTPEKLKELGISMGPNRTVELTRNRPSEELFEQSKKRLMTMLEYGITTVESKSGYGLTTESEIKILEVSRRLNEETPLDVLNTFLGAHGFPENLTKKEYLDVIINEMIPQVAERELAEFCDVWCDDGYFTAEESELILKAGLKYGMKPKIHADAYSYIGGTDLAAKMKMVSVDHLNYTPVEVMEKLVEAKVTGVLMPSLDFAVSHKRPFDARKMLDLGMQVALATDLCPASYTQSMQFVINLACRLYQFSVEEAIKAATYGGARALDLDDRGTIEEGKIADLQIWDVPTYKHIAYELGTNIVETVIKNGKVVISRWEGFFMKTNQASKASEYVNAERLQELFLELAKINAPSGKESLVAEYLKKALPELGFTLEFDEAHKKFNGEVGNLVAWREGTDPSIPPLFFSTHMDTVLPTGGLKPVIKDGVIYSDGTTILGADDRAALAAYLEAIRAIIDSGVPHGPIEFILTVNEQPGLVGATYMDYSKAKSKTGYIFDSSGDVGQTILRGPYSSRIWMEVQGNAAHIALNAEEGNSAFLLAAGGLINMKLGAIDKETLANIGIINGGELTSIIPGSVTVAGEVRSYSKEKLDAQLKHMEEVMKQAAEKKGGKVDVRIEKKYLGFDIPEDHILVKNTLEAAQNINIKTYLTETLGGADTNVLNENGLTTITLGLGFQNIHSFRECISIENLINTGRLTAALIEQWYVNHKNA